MDLEFQRISKFKRGVLLELLIDAYSFNDSCKKCWYTDWQMFDDFFFNHLSTANDCCFITTLNNQPIGFVSWDPRGLPEYVEIGHNVIITLYKGQGFGRLQLAEALKRINQNKVCRIQVTTNEILLPAQQMYEALGFKLMQKRKNDSFENFAGDYLDYVILNKGMEEIV